MRSANVLPHDNMASPPVPAGVPAVCEVIGGASRSMSGSEPGPILVSPLFANADGL